MSIRTLFAAFAAIAATACAAQGGPDGAAGDVSGGNALKDWFLDNVYGRAPVGRPADMTFEGDSIVFGGKVKIALTVKIPAAASAQKPCPVLLMGDFRTWNNGVRTDAYSKQQQEIQNRMDEYIVSRGYAVVHYNLNEAAPDQPRRNEIARMIDKGVQLPECPFGVFDLYGGETRGRTGNSWGTIRAWAWCHSRVLDWIEAHPALDGARVAVLGHSRLGKTSLCAGVTDPRFKVVYSNASGCGGAKLNRMNLPRSEHINQITDRFPRWFCDNFKAWRGRDAEIAHDQDEWMGLIAGRTRYLYVASGSADNWAGPQGEKAAAESAAKAWEALGLKGMGGHVGYHCHNGPHSLTVEDLKPFLDFCDSRL